MTNVRDGQSDEEELSPASYYINLIVQIINAWLMTCIPGGYHLFFYLNGLVLAFRLKTISSILVDLKGMTAAPSGMAITIDEWRKLVLIECHAMHIEVL